MPKPELLLQQLLRALPTPPEQRRQTLAQRWAVPTATAFTAAALLALSVYAPLLALWLWGALAMLLGAIAAPGRIALASVAAGAAVVLLWHWLANAASPAPAVVAGLALGAAGYCTGIVIREAAGAARARLQRQIYSNITDALPLCLGVLDAKGRLCTINKAWRQLACGKTPLWANEGENYLALCRASATSGNMIAAPLAEGIEAILHGSGGAIVFDYQPTIDSRIYTYRVTAMPVHIGDGKVLILHENLTEQKHMQQTLQMQEQRLQLAQEGTNDGLWEWRPLEKRLYVSERFEAMLGAAPQEHENFSQWFRQHIHPEDLANAIAAVNAHLEQGQAYDVEMRLHTHRGWRWFRARGKAQVQDGCMTRFAGSLMDISLQRDLLAQVQVSEARFREIVEHLPHVFWEFDVPTGKVTYLSPAFERTFGINPTALYVDPRAWLKLVHPEELDIARHFERHAFVDQQPAEAEFRARSANGRDVWIRNRAFPFIDANGQVQRIVGIAENISEARFYQQRLYKADHFDNVCGLPNRLLFTERLEFQCRQPAKPDRQFMVMIIAVKRLKWVDQSLGQKAKEDLIRQVAQRFTSALTDRGYLASFGGGEFAVLLSRKEDISSYESIAQNLQAALDEHFIWGTDTVVLSARIGAAQYPSDGDTSELLLKHANVALYSLQSADRSGFAIFSQDLLQSSRDTLKLETELARALQQQEFMLYYQPKYSLTEHRVCGAEALIRWQHPIHGVVGPLRFVHLLESTDLIVPVGRWCIDHALAQLAAWQRQGLCDFVMAVNVSLKQLRPELVEHVRIALEEHAIAPHLLELELTESVMHEQGGATGVVDELRAMGVRIAVDDFGTGYSTLGSLKSFVPDTLKIDKQFLNEMEHDAADQAIVRGVIAMAHALNMNVVAEGVECAQQKKMLEQLECDEIQGYLLSPPIEPKAFAERFLTALLPPPQYKARAR